MASKNGNDGRVYGGDCDLIHVEDGQRQNMGKEMAFFLDATMRERAVMRGARGEQEAAKQDLCPGCYMIVGYNALIELAEQNGQSKRELGMSMATVFKALAEGIEFNHEEIAVILDPEEVA